MSARDLTVRFLGDQRHLDKTVDGVESKFAGLGSRLSKLAIGAGAAAGAGLAFGLVETFNVQGAQAKLNAQLGATGGQAKDIGKAAGKVYASGWGESMEAVNESVKRTVQDIGITNSDELQKISKNVLVVSQTFDQDLGGVTRAVGNLMRNGLAPDAQTALDIVTRGFQNGVDKSDDFLDTLNEYSTKFRDMGLSGAEATGLMQQGLQAGARDADKVADAIKEFSIRAIDGSKTTQEGFQAIGLDAGKMGADIAAGGERSKMALDRTLDALRGIEDPVKRNAAAVALFGTQAEDLGQALFALDVTTATDGMQNLSGATDQAAASQETASMKIEAFKRTALGFATDALGNVVIPAVMALWNAGDKLLGPTLGWLGSVVSNDVGPAFVAFGRFVADNQTPLMIVAGLIAAVFIPHLIALGVTSLISGGQTAAGWAMTAGSAIWAAAVHSGAIIAQVAGWALAGGQALIQGARMAAGWVLAMGPIGWVTALVIGLVALIVANWDWVVEKTTWAWNTATGWIADRWNWVYASVIKPVADWIGGVFDSVGRGLDNLGAWFGRGVDAIGTGWDRLKEVAAAPVRFMVNTVWNDGIRKGWNAVVGLFGGTPLEEVRLGFARGGPVWGAGTETSDSIPAMLSTNEHVWSAAEVRGAGGHRAVDAMREAARNGRLPAFASGGAVWQQLWGVMRGAFPSARLTSSFRPGDRGYHGSGNAIDVAGPTPMDAPFMQRVNSWVAMNYPNSTELIYTPGINLKNGRPFTYSAGVQRDHYNHVHWAMSGGGLGAAIAGATETVLKAIPGLGTALSAVDQFMGVLDPLLGQMVRGTGYEGGVADFAKFTVDQIRGKIDDLTSFGLSGPVVSSGAGVEQWRGVVNQALGMLGQPAGYADITLRRMNQESGGNASAINNWDINAKRGTPSKGLMQVIDPTFAANRDPRAVNNIWDPLANILASMRYALRRYGSLPAAYNRAGGYALGGLVDGPNGSTQWIQAHGGEFVVAAPLVDAIKGGSAGTGRVEKHYHLTVVNAGNSLVDLEEQFARLEALDG